MLNVVSRIDDCYNGKGRPLTPERLTYIVIHRCSLARRTPENPNPIADSLLDGPALAARFKPLDMGTGGKCPYHFLVRQGGTVEQLLPVSVRGSHACGYNNMSLAVAVAGDASRLPPTAAQWAGLVNLVAALIPLRRSGLLIVGHTQLPASSEDESKVCPGQHLPTSEVMGRARARLQEDTPQWRGFTPEEARNHVIGKGIHV